MIGTIRTHKGQLYWVADTFTRRRKKDGTLAVIAVWASQCAQCGEELRFTAPAAATKFQPNRRCDKHKAPGRRVKGGRA